METALKRDRRIVIAALSLVICASWIYVLNGAGMSMSAFELSSWSRALGQAEGGQMNMPESEDMSATSRTEGSASDDMSGSPSGAMADAMAAMATPAVWTAGYATLLFFMWWIMMFAMMLPSAAPMILLYDV